MITLASVAFSVFLAASTPQESCLALVAAQDEQIALLEAQASELKAAVAGYKAAIAAREREVVALEATVDTYKKLWLAEAEFTAAERRRNVWGERVIALKWVLIGAAGGMVVERVVE